MSSAFGLYFAYIVAVVYWFYLRPQPPRSGARITNSYSRSDSEIDVFEECSAAKSDSRADHLHTCGKGPVHEGDHSCHYCPEVWDGLRFWERKS